MNEIVQGKSSHQTQGAEPVDQLAAREQIQNQSHYHYDGQLHSKSPMASAGGSSMVTALSGCDS